MIRIVVAVAALSACRPLAPGETRCTTSDIYGTQFTNCKTGQPQPTHVAQPQSSGFWCTSRADGLGVCGPQPGGCEVFRAKSNQCSSTAPGACIAFEPCQFHRNAICAPTGCFTTPAACAAFERDAKRDGSACVLR